MSEQKTLHSLALIAFVFISNHAIAQSWNYQSYSESNAALNAGQKDAPGYITLSEADGKARIQFFAGNRLNKCVAQSMEALVERTPKQIIITANPPFYGCFAVLRAKKNNEPLPQSAWGQSNKMNLKHT